MTIPRPRGPATDPRRPPHRAVARRGREGAATRRAQDRAPADRGGRHPAWRSKGTALEIIAEFEPGDAEAFGLKVRKGRARRRSSASTAAPARSSWIDRVRARRSSAPTSPDATRRSWRWAREVGPSACTARRCDLGGGLRRRRAGRPDGPDLPRAGQSGRQPVRGRGHGPPAFARSLGAATLNDHSSRGSWGGLSPTDDLSVRSDLLYPGLGQGFPTIAFTGRTRADSRVGRFGRAA